MIKIKNKISYKRIKFILCFIILFLAIDCLATCYAQDIFVTRMVIQNNLEIRDLKRREKDYQQIKENKKLTNFINTYWNNAKMIRTFPNMKIEDIHGNIIYLDSLLPEIQPYYKKIFDK